MNHSFSLLVLVGFALTAIQAGSAEAKGSKAPAARPNSGATNSGYGGYHGSGSQPAPKLPPVLNKLPNGLNTTVLGHGPVKKLPPAWNKLPNGINTTVLGHTPITHGPINGIPPIYDPPHTPVTFGGNPPRGPIHGRGNHGDWHRDYHRCWSWQCGDLCYGDSFDCYYGDFSDYLFADCDSDF